MSNEEKGETLEDILEDITPEKIAKYSQPMNREIRMSTQVTQKPASVMRAYTQQVRDHSSAMARLQDQYFAALKRAEAQYFEGVKRITDALTQSAENVSSGDEVA